MALRLLFVFLFSSALSCNEREASTNEPALSQPNEDTPPHLKNILVVDDVENVIRTDIGELKSLDDLADICTSTDGIWHNNLWSCTCEINKLFAPRWGCLGIEVSTKGMGCLKEGLSKILNEKGNAEFDQCLAGMFSQDAYLSFDADAWHKEDIKQKKNLAKSIDQDGFAFLAGEYDPKLNWYRSHLNPKLFDDTKFIISPQENLGPYGSIPRRSYLSLQPKFGFDNFSVSLTAPSTSRFSDEGLCVNALKENNILESHAQKACRQVFEVIKTIENGPLQFDKLFDLKYCGFCGINHTQISYETKFSYVIAFRNFYAIERVAYIDDNGFSSSIRFTGSGRLKSISFNFSHFLDEKTYPFMQTNHSIYTNGNFSQIQLKNTTTTSLFDLWKFFNALRIQEENQKQKVPPLHVHLLDNSFNLASKEAMSLHTNLNRLLELPGSYEQDNFVKFLREKPLLEQDYPSWDASDPRSLLKGIFLDKESTDVGHSNNMAQIVIGNLANIKISISPSLNPGIDTKNDMDRFLKSNEIFIVNCTLSKNQLSPDVFKFIVEQNPQIIFIYASGNYGGDDVIHDPQWSALEGNYPNVIVAAGYNPSSKRRITGNGGLSATVAVPNSHEGTSVAASKVTHLALRLKRKFPLMNAIEIVKLIHHHLIPAPGLPVKMQGIVNLDVSVYGSRF